MEPEIYTDVITIHNPFEAEANHVEPTNYPCVLVSTTFYDGTDPYTEDQLIYLTDFYNWGISVI